MLDFEWKRKNGLECDILTLSHFVGFVQFVVPFRDSGLMNRCAPVAKEKINHESHE